VDMQVAATAHPRPHFRRDSAAPLYRLAPGRRLGSILAAAFADNGHLGLLHQPGAGLPADRTVAPVVEFDASGNFLQAWGGPDAVPKSADGVVQWPDGHENLEIDAQGAIWIFGYEAGDHAVLRFSQDGQLLLRIGERGKPGDDASRTLLNGGATSAYHDVANHEVFIADGYANHRIVGFDMLTGTFTRMWGAYGGDPVAQTSDSAFGNPVHKIVKGPGGNLFVADRIKNRVQEFALVPGGARFVREVVVAPGSMQFGSCFDLAFSPDGAWLYVADGTSNRVWIIEMSDFAVRGWTGGHAEDEGDANAPAVIGLIHRFCIDQQGNLLLCRPGAGLQRLIFEGVW
jgi:hypothetical protein